MAVKGVGGAGGSKPAAKGKGTKSSAGTGGADFARLVSEAGAAGGAQAAGGLAGASGVAGVEALFALQETDADARGNADERARARGEEILNGLERLRLAILDGQIPEAMLRDIADRVAEQRGQLADPALAELLDEIDLRARVELAKLERAREQGGG